MKKLQCVRCRRSISCEEEPGVVAYTCYGPMHNSCAMVLSAAEKHGGKKLPKARRTDHLTPKEDGYRPLLLHRFGWWR